MGCCLSSTTGRDPNAAKAPNHHHRSPVMSRPSLEEETVKEVVLSETPFAPKPHAPDGHPRADIPEPEKEEEAKISAVDNKPEEGGGGGAGGAVAAQEDASEYSEICSVSESLSTATTITEKREDEVTSRKRGCRELAGVKQRVRRSLPVKASLERHYASGEGNRRMIKSPGPTSGLAQQNRRPSPTRTQGVATRIARAPTRHYAGSAGNGYNLGRNSCRRSRSPAIKRDNGMGRSPARSVGGSVSGTTSEESTGTGGANKGNFDKESRGKKVAEAANGDGLKKGNHCESLDNPLVSLECFIFI